MSKNKLLGKTFGIIGLGILIVKEVIAVTKFIETLKEEGIMGTEKKDEEKVVEVEKETIVETPVSEEKKDEPVDAIGDDLDFDDYGDEVDPFDDIDDYDLEVDEAKEKRRAIIKRVIKIGKVVGLIALGVIVGRVTKRSRYTLAQNFGTYEGDFDTESEHDGAVLRSVAEAIMDRFNDDGLVICRDSEFDKYRDGKHMRAFTFTDKKTGWWCSVERAV